MNLNILKNLNIVYFNLINDFINIIIQLLLRNVKQVFKGVCLELIGGISSLLRFNLILQPQINLLIWRQDHISIIDLVTGRVQVKLQNRSIHDGLLLLLKL